jgi:hypothetical protein
MNSRIAQIGCLTFLTALGLIATPRADQPRGPFEHVLLISVDGLHARDLDWYLAGASSDSPLAQLAGSGRTYTNAMATRPSDSFPGLLAMVTGGTPRSTGVYYDDGWDRSVLASTVLCPPGGPLGAEVMWKQNLDVTPAVAPFLTTIDQGKLPQRTDCSRVQPHEFPRVNNVFEVIKSAGGRTAWSDKHPAYEFLNGPSGTGIDDLFTPEIASCNGQVPCASSSTSLTTNSFAKTMAYDTMKVDAVVNWIQGLDHTGQNAAGVPTVFGMNFQSVSVGQKLDMAAFPVAVGSPPLGPTGGYDQNGNPSQPLQNAFKFVDDSLGRMLTALDQQDLRNSTLVIISAKHGNSPAFSTTLHRVDPSLIKSTINGAVLDLTAQVSADTGPIIWLKDSSKTPAAAAALSAVRGALNLVADDPATPDDEGILSGSAVADFYGVALGDSRLPDIILKPLPGTLYSLSKTKIADHGSFNEDDVHVALIVSNPRLGQMIIDDPVETRQIACTILRALGQNCDSLQSQAIEPSTCLPPMGWAFGHGDAQAGFSSSSGSKTRH